MKTNKQYGKMKRQRDDLLKACEEWMKYESEMPENHPSPCHIMRGVYRKHAVKLSGAGIANVKNDK